jgi:hypothetical protein
MTKNYVPTKKLADLDLNSELKSFDLNLLSKRGKAISVADYRSERGDVVAAILYGHAALDDNEVVKAYADRLKACADRNNFYLTDGFVDYLTGETFSGFGGLFGCGLKLCQNCTARLASRNRGIAVRAVENTKLIRREHECYAEEEENYKLFGEFALLPETIKRKTVIEQEELRAITLTMPQVFGSLVLTMQVHRRAWDLFRKLKFTKIYLTSIIKGVEFTIRENGTYHVHSHLLVSGFFLQGYLFKHFWTECVRKAFEEFGLEFKVDKFLDVKFQQITTIEEALIEVCKYLTKSESWDKIPAAHLLEIAEVKRWDRMFEVSGNFRKTLSRLKAERALAEEVLSSHVNKESTFTEGVARGLTYFNTDGIVDGSVSEASESFGISEEISDKSSVKAKRISWREVVKEQGLEKYREIFYRQVEFTRNLRKLRLIIKYPDANFTDLDGNAWDLAEIEAFAQRIASRGIELGI